MDREQSAHEEIEEGERKNKKHTCTNLPIMYFIGVMGVYAFMHVVLCTALLSNFYITHYFFFPAPTLAFAFPRTFFCLFLRSFRCFLVAFGFSYKPSCSTSTHISVHTHNEVHFEHYYTQFMYTGWRSM